MQGLSAAAGVELTFLREISGSAYVLRLPGRMRVADVESMARRMASVPGVEYAEPDRIMFPALVPNDPQYGAQWHYFETYGLNASGAWDASTGSSQVRVAVIDSGITDHPDLAGRWVGGYDFVANVTMANDGGGRDTDPHDPGDWVTSAESASGPLAGCPVTNSSWHGTHTAGTVGAAGNNGNGVAGINWVSPLVPVRVTGKCGGYVSDIADGMRWAAGLSVPNVPANAHPAKVLNVSISGPGVCSSTYQNAIDAVNATNSIIVVSAGNNASNLNTNSYQPGNCSGVIAVAATDRGGDRAQYSNYGSTIEIGAPGGETFTDSPSPAPQNGVLSTTNTGVTTPVAGGYDYKQGTSMAAPHVSGVVSLMASIDGSIDFAETVEILQETAQPFRTGSLCNTTNCGAGTVDAAAALAALGPETVVTTSIAIVGNSVVLDWNDIPSAAVYHVYRGLEPSFTPSVPLAEVTASTYQDGGALSAPHTNYYYLVAAAAGDGAVLDGSDTAAIVHFTLTAGANSIP
jgi:serine protease